MRRALLLLAFPAALAVACIVPPDDREQIRDLVEDRARALARNDAAALYRLHDLDFRSICPLERFSDLPRPAEPAASIRSIEIQGQRAWATLEPAGSGGDERLAFVRDAGRWYLYAEVDACLGAALGWPSPARQHDRPAPARYAARTPAHRRGGGR